MVVLAQPICNSDDLSANCKVNRTCLQSVPEEDLLSSAPKKPRDSARLCNRRCTKQVTDVRSVPEAIDKMDLDHNEDLTRLWYSQESNDTFLDSRNNLTFVAGMYVHCPACVRAPSKIKEHLDKDVKFVVQPPLPEGLTLDRRTGLISGIACHTQNASSTHLITVGVYATGKGGIRSGMLPLTTCTIDISIEDTQELFQYFISNGISC
mmetsp:Transcript_10160/g.16494  ORF Transcript_10160/g.16494 Transcript_10160/m.16494 type:complete len:208 (+) Transcript_10160:62-685(+)